MGSPLSVVRLMPAFVLLALPAVLTSVDPAHARGQGERIEVEAQGACGSSSAIRLRLRAEGGLIRTDVRVRTSRRGTWRLAVFHERRRVAYPLVRSTAAEAGFSYRLHVPDYAAADTISVRASSPSGEVCTARGTVSGSGAAQS